MHVQHRNKALCALRFILFSRSYSNKWSVTVALVRGGLHIKPIVPSWGRRTAICDRTTHTDHLKEALSLPLHPPVTWEIEKRKVFTVVQVPSPGPFIFTEFLK